MEIDERMASDVPDAYIAPDATAAQGSNENEALHQFMEMAHPGETGLERDSTNVEVLKMTSGNVTKRLGTRRETRVTTQASKNTATTTLQMATQERHTDKFRMQEWKRKTVVEFAYELQVVRSAQAKKMKAQRQGFEMKLSMMGKRLELCEAKASSCSLTDEINALKRKEVRQKRHKQQAIQDK